MVGYYILAFLIGVLIGMLLFIGIVIHGFWKFWKEIRNENSIVDN